MSKLNRNIGVALFTASLLGAAGSVYADADFDKNLENAQKWGDENFTKWGSDLTFSQVEDLGKILTSPKINEELEEYRGDVTKVDENEQKIIREIDKMLNTSSAQAPESVYIYTDVPFTKLGFNSNYFYKDDFTLDADKVKNWNQASQYELLNGYTVGKLWSSTTETSKNSILFRIKVPKGESMAYTATQDAILPRDRGLKITNINTIVEQGRERIKITAELVPKETIVKNIITSQKQINDSVNTKMKLDKSTDFVKLDFTGREVGREAQSSSQAIDAILKNIPKRVLRDTVKRLNQIKLIDKPIMSYEGYESLPKDMIGKYHDGKREILLQTNHTKLLNNENTSYDVSRALIHEMAHAVDYLVLGKVSTQPRFKQIYEQYKDKLSDVITTNNYASENSTEFFAEIFKCMYSTDLKQREAVKKEAPDAVSFIEEKVSEYVPEISN